MLALPPPRVLNHQRDSVLIIRPTTAEHCASLTTWLRHWSELLSRPDWLAVDSRRERALRAYSHAKPASCYTSQPCAACAPHSPTPTTCTQRKTPHSDCAGFFVPLSQTSPPSREIQTPAPLT